MRSHEVPRRVPQPPSYAWDWLQRSRPVVHALSQRLTGGPPSPGFVDELRAAFADDPFVHAVVIDTVAETAFAGRVPPHRPAGVQWDRGLSWWAATLAGVSRREFERGTPVGGRQAALFGSSGASDTAVEPDGGPVSPQSTGPASAAQPDEASAPLRPSPVVTLERRRVANALRSLLETTGGRDVPAAAVRQLLHDLESSA